MQLEITGSTTVELAYYNPRMALWEPLLEPVEIPERYGPPELTPWTLAFEVNTNACLHMKMMNYIFNFIAKSLIMI